MTTPQPHISRKVCWILCVFIYFLWILAFKLHLFPALSIHFSNETFIPCRFFCLHFPAKTSFTDSLNAVVSFGVRIYFVYWNCAHPAARLDWAFLSHLENSVHRTPVVVVGAIAVLLKSPCYKSSSLVPITQVYFSHRFAFIPLNMKKVIVLVLFCCCLKACLCDILWLYNFTFVSTSFSSDVGRLFFRCWKHTRSEWKSFRWMLTRSSRPQFNLLSKDDKLQWELLRESVAEWGKVMVAIERAAHSIWTLN